jgi:hypothetical protein
MHIVIFTVYWYVLMNADDNKIAEDVRESTEAGRVVIAFHLNNRMGNTCTGPYTRAPLSRHFHQSTASDPTTVNARKQVQNQ